MRVLSLTACFGCVPVLEYLRRSSSARKAVVWVLLPSSEQSLFSPNSLVSYQITVEWVSSFYPRSQIWNYSFQYLSPFHDLCKQVRARCFLPKFRSVVTQVSPFNILASWLTLTALYNQLFSPFNRQLPHRPRNETYFLGLQYVGFFWKPQSADI